MSPPQCTYNVCACVYVLLSPSLCVCVLVMFSCLSYSHICRSLPLCVFMYFFLFPSILVCVHAGWGCMHVTLSLCVHICMHGALSSVCMHIPLFFSLCVHVWFSNSVHLLSLLYVFEWVHTNSFITQSHVNT